MTRFRQYAPPALLAAGFAGLGAAVAAYWRADLSAVDRYLVLAGAVWAAAVRWRQATTAPDPRPVVGGIFAACGAVLHPVGWAAYFVLFNARSLPFWVLWLSLVFTSVGWLFAAFGRRAVVKLLFPLVFIAFALPRRNRC